jgi:hypothetical protein
MQDAMRRWRHLGLGLAAAKERPALTVVNLTRSIVTGGLQPDLSLREAACRT